MSEKRFVFVTNEKWFLFDNEDEEYMDMEDCKDKLNEQQATITHLEKVNGKNFAKRRLLEQDNLALQNENEQLRQQLKQKEEEEKLYAKEILRLNELNKQTSEYKDILGDY